MFRNVCSTFRLRRTYVSKRPTVDPLEMEHFKKLSQTWWDKKGLLAPLHHFNKFRIPWIRDSLVVVDGKVDATPLEGLNVLDVGCGGGILTESLSRLGCNTTGLDANFELIEVARSHAKNQNLSNLRYVCETIQEHTKNNTEKYDVIVCSETIEHVTEKDEFVRSMVESLKPKGSLFVTTPNKNWASWFFFIVLSENVLKIIPKGTHRYQMFIHEDDLIQMLNQENCRTVFTTGLLYNPFSKYWKVIESKDVTYALHAVKDI